MTDDQGYGDVSFTGNDRLETPHLSQLAEGGTVFSSFYVSPVCAPTRASLMTGRYHLRTGVRGVVRGRETMAEAEVTLAELLQEAGYATAIFGKWHLGETYPRVPRAQGFDEFIGFRDGSSHYFDQVLDHNGTPYPTEGYLTDVFTDEAIGFIEENREQPFFVYLPYNAPHTPLEVPDAYMAPYQDLPEYTRKVYGMMAAVDENIGRLLSRVEELGLTGETLVLLLSDNGPLYGERNPGYEEHKRYNCGLRGTKFTVYEGGMRVPLVARWPGRVPAGREVTRRAAHIDVLPTVLDYANLPLPDSLAIDGRSLRPLLENENPNWPQRTLFMNYPGESVLQNQDPAPYPGGMAVEDRYKMVDGEELYDLKVDPGETRNLAAEKPGVLDSLDAAYRAFWRDASNERTPNPRIQVGHPEENPTLLSVHRAKWSGDLQWRVRATPTGHRGMDHLGLGVLSHGTDVGTATWQLAFQADARYRATLRLRCPAEANPRVRIQAAGRTAERTITECTGQWTEQELGTLRVPAGAHDLALTVLGSSSDRSLDFSVVILERL